MSNLELWKCWQIRRDPLGQTSSYHIHDWFSTVRIVWRFGSFRKWFATILLATQKPKWCLRIDYFATRLFFQFRLGINGTAVVSPMLGYVSLPEGIRPLLALGKSYQFANAEKMYSLSLCRYDLCVYDGSRDRMGTFVRDTSRPLASYLSPWALIFRHDRRNIFGYAKFKEFWTHFFP